MNFGTWNVQGINTKQKEVFDQLEKYQMDVVVLTETKKKGDGNEEIGSYIHFYSGVPKCRRAKAGVSIVLHKKLRKYIRNWEEVDERIMKMELEMRGHNIVIVGVYAPTDDALVNIKDDFDHKLTRLLVTSTTGRRFL